jgi:hypothetical protein
LASNLSRNHFFEHIRDNIDKLDKNDAYESSNHHKEIHMRLFLLSFISFCIMLSSAAYADNATSTAKPKPLAPVTFQDGNVFDPMKFAVIGKYVYYDQFKIYTGSSKDDPGFGKRRRTAHAGQLTFRAGLFEGFEAFLTATAFDKELERKNAKGLTDESDVQGLGDIQVMGRWQALSQKKGAPLSLALGLGLELPTAASANRNSFGTQPYMGPFLQLGTGSWTQRQPCRRHGSSDAPAWMGSSCTRSIPRASTTWKKATNSSTIWATVSP